MLNFSHLSIKCVMYSIKQDQLNTMQGYFIILSLAGKCDDVYLKRFVLRVVFPISRPGSHFLASLLIDEFESSSSSGCVEDYFSIIES